MRLGALATPLTVRWGLLTAGGGKKLAEESSDCRLLYGLRFKRTAVACTALRSADGIKVRLYSGTRLRDVAAREREPIQQRKKINPRRRPHPAEPKGWTRASPLPLSGDGRKPAQQFAQEALGLREQCTLEMAANQAEGPSGPRPIN